MSQIIKAFMALYMVLYMMVSATGLLGAFFQVLHAQNLHSSIVDELENSNYANSVIVECFGVAEKAEYELEITLYPEYKPAIVLDNIGAVPSEIEEISMARVCLKYPFQVLFFEINDMQEICGYAR